MPRILVIDDDPIISKMVSAVLVGSGYEAITAASGLEGLSLVESERPDAVITDVLMPGIDGYEVTRRLRRDSRWARLPIMMLTGQTNLEEKLKAFEVGADEYMSKPFEPAELKARLARLLQWGDAAKVSRPAGGDRTERAHFVAVHSLRGGSGCSSIAVNLALGFAGLWGQPTLLLDLVLAAGQVALMLNIPLKRTWADLARFDVSEVDEDLLQTVISTHESGLDIIAAPSGPEEADALTGELLATSLDLLRAQYSYVVADVTHDFCPVALQALDAADLIVLVLTPDMASVRAASAALATYLKLDYDDAKIKLILNWTFSRHGLARQAIESALHFPITQVIPFDPDRFVQAINHGVPLLHGRPAEPTAALIEDMAFRLSREKHQLIPPAVPSPAWQRVNERLSAAADRRRQRS